MLSGLCRRVWFSLASVAAVASALAAQTAVTRTGEAQTYTIAGTVVSKTDNHPLARARVTVANVKDLQHPRSLVTGDDGKFAVSSLPAGKYMLQGAKKGFITGSYEQHDQFSTAIVTGQQLDTEHLLLRINPAAYVTGKVLDENGDPVRRASVRLYLENHQDGASQIVTARDSMTNDLGFFELGPQIPGRYFLAVKAEPWYAVRAHLNPQVDAATHIDSGLDVVYPVTYYGDTTEAESATPFTLSGGERFEVEVHLAPVQSVHLLVRVPQSANGGYAFPRLSQKDLGDQDWGEAADSQMVSPGIWEVTAISQGHYQVLTQSPAANEGSQTTDVNAGPDSQIIDATSGAALVPISASVKLVGENNFPPRLAVGLRKPHGALKAWSFVDEKGHAELSAVAPGSYEVIQWNFGRPYSIASLSAENTQAAGHVITVASGTAPKISLTLVGGNVSISGVVQKDGKPVAGAMVVLVPKAPADHLDMFRRDQSDQDGTFTVQAVAPGEYTIVAIQDGWELEWSEPSALAAYLAHGQTVQVSANTNHSMTLASAVEAQFK